MNKTEFEKDLEAYFPDIYALHLLGKEDKKLWIIVKELEKLIKDRNYAEIRVIIQDGIIDRIMTTTTK